MDQDHCEYIWNNFRHLIEPSTHYSKYLRAALFPVNENWPDANEIRELQARYSKDFLNGKHQEIESNKVSKIIKSLYESIKEEIYFNYCPSCGALAVSPKSEKCLECNHEWYGANIYKQTHNK